MIKAISMSNLFHMYNYIGDEGAKPLLTLNSDVEFRIDGKWVATTYGRLLIWEAVGILPEGELDKTRVRKLVCDINLKYSASEAVKKLKDLQDISFKYATSMSSTLCVDDFKVDKSVHDRIQLTAKEVVGLDDADKAIKWDAVITSLEHEWIENVDRHNPLFEMFKSGARVSHSQIRQMVISKGLLTNMSGTLNADAVEGCLAGGLKVHDYFKTIGPARRGLAANQFVVPASGYFARQMVLAARDLLIHEQDCGTVNGVEIESIEAVGRYSIDDDVLIDKAYIDYLNVDFISIRSPITCESSGGVCSKCCGIDPANHRDWKNGFRMGIASAQHLSEATTQLGLRGKHCVSADTEFLDVNGKSISMESAYDRVESQGESIYVHSCSTSGEIEVGKVKKVWQERWDKMEIQITLDNGKICKSTLDHPFLLRSGLYSEAQNLKVGDSLMPYYTEVNNEGYNEILNNKTGKYELGYRLSSEHRDCENIYKEGVLQRHHKDFKKGDDYPSNILICSDREHLVLHQEEAQREVQRGEREQWVGWEPNYEAMSKIANHNKSKARRVLSSESVSKWIKSNPEQHLVHVYKGLESQRKLRETSDWGTNSILKTVRTKCELAIKRQIDLEDFDLSSTPGTGSYSVGSVLSVFPELVTDEYPWHSVTRIDPYTKDQLKIVTMYNKVKDELGKLGYEMTEKNYDKVSFSIYKPHSSYRSFKSIIKAMPINSTESKKVYLFDNNHEIVKIEIIESEIGKPYYDLEVDSKWHNYPLESGVFVHNTSGAVTIESFNTRIDSTLAQVIKAFGSRGTSEVRVGDCEAVSIKDIEYDDVSVFQLAAEHAMYVQGLYKGGGIHLNLVHFEMMLRACTDLVAMNNGDIGIRSQGDKGTVIMTSIPDSVKKNPSWLRSISFEGVKKRLTEAVTYQQVSYNTESERIITTKLT